jgi:type I restriction enzyme, S subunit
METKKQDWKMVKLGEVLKHRKGFIQIDDLEKYKLCRVQTSARGVVLRSEVYGSEIRTKKQQVCKAGDFLVAEIDAKMGGYGIVPEDLEGAIVSSHYFLYDVFEGELDKIFLEFYTKTPRFFEQVKAEGSTNYAAIRPNDVLTYEIPLPPLAEQQRIAGRLAVLKGKIDAVRGLRGEQMREVERILKNAFDFVISDTGFPKKKISEVATFKTGKTPPTSHPHYFEGDLDWYCPSDINNQKDCYLQESSKKISQDALDDNKATWYEKGTVLLISIGGTIGKVGILKEAASSNQQITGIKFDESVLPEFGYYWLKKCKPEILKRAGQATLPIINQKKIGEIEIVLPDLTEQRHIVAEVQAFQTKMEQLKAAQSGQLAELEGLFPAVLERAFRGEW